MNNNVIYMAKLSFSQAMQKHAQLKLWMIGIGALLLVIVSTLYLFFYIQENPKSIAIMLLFLIYAGVVFGSYFLYKFLSHKLDIYTDKQFAAYHSGKMGADGENMVQSWLEEVVSKEKIFPNVTLPGHKCDIDFVVASPSGLIVVEVKNFSKDVLFDQGKYFKKISDHFKLMPTIEDPRIEALNHAKYLKKYLDSEGLGKIKIYKVVVFPSGKVDFNGPTGVYVVKDEIALCDYIENLPLDSNWTTEAQGKIENLMADMCIKD
jgi:hypothetical protein